ncbi:MAG: hypothetical protein AD742_20420 [Methylibium sp. NZG]|nr:MAG: hypothetical protein AD742_20420 [Methylibium sp. NZG]
MMLSDCLRYLWAAPATVVGLAPAALACAFGATVRVTDGVLEVAGARSDRLRRFGRSSRRRGGGRFVAITFGHVVIGQSHAVLDELRAHEHEHVRQYERWGVLFFAAYLGSSAAQWWCGRDPYRDNRFERQARAAE